MVEFVHYNEPRGPRLFRFGRYSFSTIEIKHLLIALLMITATLMVFRIGDIAVFGFWTFFIINILTIGFAFLFHEFGHKFVAQFYGFVSEFRADFLMLLFALGLAIFSPIIFIAPGAVMIYGRLSVRQNGIISVAGPIVNLVLALIFILLNFIISPVSGSVLAYLFWVGIWVNAFLGLFNMLPFWVLDGKKVLAWNKPIFFFMIASFLAILFMVWNGYLPTLS